MSVFHDAIWLPEAPQLRGIVTKRRTTKVPKYNGGIPFT